MQGGVVVGPVTVPLEVILTLFAGVIGAALCLSFTLTIGLSVYRAVVDRRNERVRPALESELLDRLYGDDPAWAEWVGTLSARQRRVLESVLDSYLRELDGGDADRLRELGDALGIPERAGRTLVSGHTRQRLRALTWLTLLRRPGPYRKADYEPTTPAERASVARLLLSDPFTSPPEAIALLLDGATQEFSAFGQDTLYRLARESPTAMFALADEQHRDWPSELLTQVLLVTRHLGTSVRIADLPWLIDSLESDDEGVRAAAARALGSFGWEPQLRDSRFLSRTVEDPSPRVRGAVYEMLGAWGDEEALTVLLYALVSEDNPRALTRGTSTLVKRRDLIGADGPAVLGTAWAWSTAHAHYDSVVRGRSRTPI